MEEQEEFEEIGLTKNESKAYEALVKFGKLTAGETSAKSGVPYSRIYDILESLVHRGIVETIPEKTKKFIPSNPEHFLEIIKKKEEKLEKIKEKIKEMKQFYDIKEKNPVTMAFGRAGFYKIVKELSKSTKYSYSIKWTSEIKPEWIKETKEKLKKGIDVKSLVRKDKETEKNIKDWIKVNKNMRVLENEGFACSIIDDKEVMLSLIKSNVTLLVKDEAFTKVMKKLFLSEYEKAETIN